MNAITTRKAILDAVRKIISENGTKDFTLDKVARVAGVSKGGLLYHFKSRRSIAEAFLGECLEKCLLELEALKATQPPRGALMRLFIEQMSCNSEEATQERTTFCALLTEDSELIAFIRSYEMRRHFLLAQDGLKEEIVNTIVFALNGMAVGQAYQLAPRELMPDLVLAKMFQTFRHWTETNSFSEPLSPPSAP